VNILDKYNIDIRQRRRNLGL